MPPTDPNLAMTARLAAEAKQRALRDEVESFRRVTTIDPLRISSEFSGLPSDYAFWTAKYADAVERHLAAEHDLEHTEARLSMMSREMLALRGGKTTEACVRENVVLHPDYAISKMTAIEATADKEKLRGVMEALRTKREMLVSLGAHLRAEMSVSPGLREEMASATQRGIESGRRDDLEGHHAER